MVTTWLPTVWTELDNYVGILFNDTLPTAEFIYYIIFIILLYICQLQLGYHPVAAVRYTFTHKQYTVNTIDTNNM
jgi:hypothetical protein